MLRIILTVILIMPGNQKDVEQSHDIASLDKCFEAARAWMDQDPKRAGGIGLAAGCSSVPAKGPPA